MKCPEDLAGGETRNTKNVAQPAGWTSSPRQLPAIIRWRYMRHPQMRIDLIPDPPRFSKPVVRVHKMGGYENLHKTDCPQTRHDGVRLAFIGRRFLSTTFFQIWLSCAAINFSDD